MVFNDGQMKKKRLSNDTICKMKVNEMEADYYILVPNND